MSNNLSEKDFQAILRALSEKTRSGQLIWAKFPDSTMDEEYETLAGRFRYFVARGVADPWADSDAPQFRLEIWKLHGDADGKNLLVHDTISTAGESPLANLFELAKRGALGLDTLADDILGDLNG